MKEDDTPFAKLPSEVQNIVRLLTGERYTSAKFNLSVTLEDDPAKKNRSVKTYNYHPKVFSKNLNAEVLATENFQFKRQNKTLKLESAELNTQP